MGGTGSGCPALLANKSLVALAAASVTDVFEDHDGVLALKLTPQQHFFFWNWFSDSGKYLLPFDKFDKSLFEHTQQ